MKVSIDIHHNIIHPSDQLHLELFTDDYIFYATQGRIMRCSSILLIFLHLFFTSNGYQPDPTQWICIEPTRESSSTVASCLPGYVIEMVGVVLESTLDDSCSSTTRCQVEQKSPLLAPCHRKRICQIDVNTLRASINQTCGPIKRFYTKFRCLPVIQEQKDHLCEAPTGRRLSLGDINLSCPRNYRLHISSALIGLSLKGQDEATRSHFKCNKDTQTICHSYVSDIYRGVCHRQLGDQCKIKYIDRPNLRDCLYGTTSNFSMVEYLCIPDERIIDDLPKIDLCSTEFSDRLRLDRGLLHTSKEDLTQTTDRSCAKQIFVSRQSRLRLFLLENSLSSDQSFEVRLDKQLRSLTSNELIDLNLTRDEIMEVQWKSRPGSSGRALLYFQIDSSTTEAGALRLLSDDDRRGKTFFRRDWVILIGSIIACLVLILAIGILFLIMRISKQRRRRALRYLMPDDDDQHQHLKKSPDHPEKSSHLLSSSPVVLPNSSIVVQPDSEEKPLIKGKGSDIDNFYEEIKEQQQQTALALSQTGNKGDDQMFNPYLEARSLENETLLFKDHPSTHAIRDHHENDKLYHQPSSTAVKKPAPKKSPIRHDLDENKPSAPPPDSQA